MQKCKLCDNRAVWKCNCSPLFFCASHIQRHLTPNKQHLLTPTFNILSSESSVKFKKEIKARVSQLTDLQRKIENKTLELISYLNALKEETLGSINNLKSYYESLVEKNSYSEEESESIERILTTRLILKVPESFLIEASHLYKNLYTEQLNFSTNTEENLKFLNENWGLLLQGHTKEINTVSISHEKLALSSSDDSTVRIWDPSTLQQKTCIKVHKVTCAIWANGQNTIVTGSDESLINVWNLEETAENVTLQGHGKGIKSLALTANNKVLASGSADHTIRLWDMTSYDCIQIISGHSDSVTCIIIYKQLLISASADASAKIWNISSYSLEKSLNGHLKSVNSLAISQDSSFLFSGSSDKTIKIWSLKSQDKNELVGHSDNVLCVCLISGEKRLASSSADKTIKVWNLRTLECEKNIETRAVVWSLACLADDFVVAGGDNVKIGIWDLNEEVFTLFPGHFKVITKVEGLDDNNRVVSKSKDGTVRIWNLKERKEEAVFYDKTDLGKWSEVMNGVQGYFD